MSAGDNDSEFYIGYLGETPAATARFLRKVIFGLLVLVLSVGLLVGFYLEKIDRGRFEFGIVRSYQGSLFAQPIPMLATQDRIFILVGDGKFGANLWAEKWAREAQRKEIVIRGTLIEREPIAMLEIDRGIEPKILNAERKPSLEKPSKLLGEVELQGELVDSKCYLGVMRPAVGKVHRACAIRCLSGGVPPGILIRNARVDSSILILLAGLTSGLPSFSPKWAGLTIRAKGQLEIRNGLPILQTTGIKLVP